MAYTIPPKEQTIFLTRYSRNQRETFAFTGIASAPTWMEHLRQVCRLIFYRRYRDKGFGNDIRGRSRVIFVSLPRRIQSRPRSFPFKAQLDDSPANGASVFMQIRFVNFAAGWKGCQSTWRAVRGDREREKERERERELDRWSNDVTMDLRGVFLSRHVHVFRISISDISLPLARCLLHSKF